MNNIHWQCVNSIADRAVAGLTRIFVKILQLQDTTEKPIGGPGNGSKEPFTADAKTRIIAPGDSEQKDGRKDKEAAFKALWETDIKSLLHGPALSILRQSRQLLVPSIDGSIITSNIYAKALQKCATRPVTSSDIFEALKLGRESFKEIVKAVVRRASVVYAVAAMKLIIGASDVRGLENMASALSNCSRSVIDLVKTIGFEPVCSPPPLCRDDSFSSPVAPSCNEKHLDISTDMSLLADMLLFLDASRKQTTASSSPQIPMQQYTVEKDLDSARHGRKFLDDLLGYRTFEEILSSAGSELNCVSKISRGGGAITSAIFRSNHRSNRLQGQRSKSLPSPAKRNEFRTMQPPVEPKAPVSSTAFPSSTSTTIEDALSAIIALLLGNDSTKVSARRWVFNIVRFCTGASNHSTLLQQSCEKPLARLFFSCYRMTTPPARSCPLQQRRQRASCVNGSQWRVAVDAPHERKVLDARSNDIFQGFLHVPSHLLVARPARPRRRYSRSASCRTGSRSLAGRHRGRISESRRSLSPTNSMSKTAEGAGQGNEPVRVWATLKAGLNCVFYENQGSSVSIGKTSLLSLPVGDFASNLVGVEAANDDPRKFTIVKRGCSAFYGTPLNAEALRANSSVLQSACEAMCPNCRRNLGAFHRVADTGGPTLPVSLDDSRSRCRGYLDAGALSFFACTEKERNQWVIAIRSLLSAQRTVAHRTQLCLAQKSVESGKSMEDGQPSAVLLPLWERLHSEIV